MRCTLTVVMSSTADTSAMSRAASSGAPTLGEAGWDSGLGVVEVMVLFLYVDRP
jgi:hypothetical protein